MTTAPKTILVVDDDPDITLQITAVLQSEGYTVRSAATADEAEELLLSVRPDVAILDLMMEEKDSGFMLCHTIKRLYPETPVMLLTGVKASTGLSFTSGADEERSWLKADLVVDKPVRPERLRANVKRLLEQRKDDSV